MWFRHHSLVANRYSATRLRAKLLPQSAIMARLRETRPLSSKGGAGEPRGVEHCWTIGTIRAGRLTERPLLRPSPRPRRRLAGRHAPIETPADGWSAPSDIVWLVAPHYGAHLRHPDRRLSLRSVRNKIEHRGIVVPGVRIANTHAERRCAGGTRRGDLVGRHAEMPEDPADHGRLSDERDQTQAAATPATRQHIKPEGARHQRRPTLAASLAPRRLRGVRFTSWLGGRFLQFRLATITVWRRTTSARQAARGPSRQWYSIRLMRGRGTSTVSRPRNSIGSNTTSVVPSRHGCRSCSRT